MSNSTNRLRSTGRKPALTASDVRSLLERYFDGSNVSVADLAAEMKVTQATVRKYLKAAGILLPRGLAARLPRATDVNVQSVMNRIPTDVLLGTGRTELLRRRLEAGESMTSLAKSFDISRDRVRSFRDEAGLAPEPGTEGEPSAPESGPEAPEAASDSPEE